MRRLFATVLIATVTTTAVGAGVALAEDLEVTPAAPEEGEADLTIEVSDFDPDTPIYAVPCDVPQGGDELDVTTDTCDISAVTTATTDGNGNATIVVSWDIPADGIAIYVGDEARNNQATMILTPAVAAEPEPEPDPDVAVLGTTVVQEDLADTGPREVMLLVTLAAVIIGMGVALRGAERSHTQA